MAYENILFEKKDQIGYLTFNRPKVLNALNRQTMMELGSCLAAVKDDPEVRVLILTGAGEKAFIAGADINELSQRTPVDGKEFSLLGQAVLHQLETLGKPSIAYFTASGAFSMIFRAVASAAGSNSAGSVTRFTKPMRSASSAVIISPVRHNSCATPFPHSRARRCVPP